MLLKLFERLDTATLFPQNEIDKGVITMNSRVQAKDLATKRVAEANHLPPGC